MHYTSLLCLICFLSMVDCRPREKKHRTSLYDDFQINNSGSWSQPRSFYHHEDHKVESPKRVTKIRGSNGSFHNGQSVSAPREQEEQRKKENLENHSVWEDNVPVRTVGHVSLTDGEKDSENHRVPKDNVPVITAGQISLTDGSENHKDKISVITAGQISLTDKDKTLDEERDQSSDEDSNDDDDNEDDTAEDYDDQSDVLEQSDKDEDISDGSQTDDDDGRDNDVIDKEKGRKKPEIVKNSRTQKGNEAGATSKWSQKMQQIINEVYGGQLPYSPTKNPVTQQLYINPTTEVEKNTEVSTAPVDSIETAKSVEQYTEKSSETSLEMSNEIKDGNNLVTMESETHMVINGKRLEELGRLNMKSATASSPVVHREMEDVSDNGKKVRSSEETESEKSLNLEKLTSTPMETTENQQRSYNNVNVDISDQGHLKVNQQGNEEVIAGEETSYPKENLESHREEALDTKENLESLREEALDIKGNLESHREEALDTKEYLESHREEALDTKENLESHREEALDTKENLESHREEALDTKENLESHREEALDTKENLESHREEALDIKGNLESHREEALDTKENLESHREEALDTKGNLESHREEALDTKGNLESHREEALDTKGNLERHRGEALDTKENLESHREEALDTKTVLQDKKDIGSGEGSDIAKSTSTAAPSTRPNPPTTMLSDVTHVSKMNDVKIYQVSKPYETCQDDGYCPPGRICHRGYCVCGDESLCRRHRKPVCGSDGVLYPSHCELHRTACIHVKHIKIDPLAMCDKRLNVGKSSPQRPKTVRGNRCEYLVREKTEGVLWGQQIVPTQAYTLDECLGSCDRDYQNCIGFEFSAENTQCSLYKQSDDVIFWPNDKMSYYEQSRCKTVLVQNCDFQQIKLSTDPIYAVCDVTEKTSPEFLECEASCGHCKAFTYKSHGGVCRLYYDDACVNMLNDQGQTHYVRECQKNDQHCQVLQIIPGHSPYMCSKATVKASNMIECHDTCIRGHCEAFRFKYSGFCEIFFDKSCVSMLEKGKDNYYVRRCTNPADCKYEEVETVVNTPCDILSSNTDTFEACRDACDDCVAIKYVLNTGECSIYQQASCITKHKVNYITRNCSPPNTTVQQNSPQVTPTFRSDKQQFNSLPTVLRGHGHTSTVQSHQTDPILGQNSNGNSRKTEENVVISVSLTTTDPRREDKGNNGIQSQDRLKGEMPQGEMSQGDDSHRDMSQGDDSHRDMSQGDDSHRDMSQGDDSHRDISQGDDSHRDMSQGDDSHRDMSQGDGSHRDMSQGDGSQGNRPHEEVQISGPQTILSENHFRRPETKEGPLFTEICTKQEYVRMKADILRYHCVRFGEKNCGKDILPKKGYTAALMFSYYDRNMDGFIQGDELWQIWVIEKFERMFPSCSLFNLFKFEESYDDGKINREQFIQIFDIPDEDLREEIHVLKTLSTVGNGLEIRCGIQPSSESSQIIWERNNVNLEKINFPDVAVFSDGTLYFETVQILHIGNWTCHDRDRPGVKQVHVLRVHSPPIVHVSHTPDLLSGADIDLYLHCHAEGLPRPTIQWLFNGKPLASEHKHYLMIHNNGTLRIHNADFKRDTGAYKCQGKNPAGQTDDVSTIVIVDPKEKYPVFNHRQRQESSFVFHSDGYNVYNPVDCITQRLVRKTFGNLKYIPEELDEAPSLCKSSCHWGQAVNVRNKYIYISQPEQNRVVVIDSAKSKNPVEFIETDKVPVKVHYVEHLDEVWVLCWNSEHDTGSKTIIVIRDASQDFRHSIVHTQPIGYRFDLVQDIFLPPSNDLKHEFKYGYVIHNEQRGLFKLEMDSMHYTKAVDLSMFDCVPQHVEYIPIGGHIVVKCLQRTASGSQTLQILLDYITDIPLANTTMFGTPYVTPDSRNLITVDEVSGQVKVAKILDNGQIQKAFEVTTGSSISDVTFFPSEIGDGYDAFLVSRDSPEIYSVSLYNGKVTTIKGIGEPKKMKVSRYSASTRSVVHGDVFSDYLATASQTSLVIVSGKFHEAHCDFFNLKNPDVVMYNVVTMK